MSGTEEFSFPTLPKPKRLGTAPASSRLPSQNPLLAGATISDASAGSKSSSSGAAAAAGGAPSAAAAMGAEFSVPELPAPSRHTRLVAPPRPTKVPFEKGYSQMDWVRLTQTHPDLAGLKGGRPRRDISLEEVALHQTPEDAWTVLRGKVYNLTPYMRFHPGGAKILLTIAGRDGTALFNKFHAWVNSDFLLAKCMVGQLAPPPPPSSSGGGGGGPQACSGEQQQQQQQQQHVPGSNGQLQQHQSAP